MGGACERCGREGFVVLCPDPVPGVDSETPELCVKCLEECVPLEDTAQESPPKE